MSEQESSITYYVSDKEWVEYKTRQLIREILHCLICFILGIGFGALLIDLVLL